LSISITRQALYERIWDTPLRRLADEFGVDTLAIKTACDRGDIPRPDPHTGYWTKRELHLPIDQPALGPAPEGCPDLLVIEPTPVRRRQPRADPVALAAEEAVAALGWPTVPETEAAEPPVAAPEPAKPSPTHPTTLTRQALYEAVWQTPMVRLAETYGVSGNGLAKICGRYDIPYPARGFWAKTSAGQDVAKAPLPNPKHASEEKITIRPTPPKPSEELPSAVNGALEAVKSRLPAIHVAERLAKPHPVIAEWIAEREDRRREARRARQSGWGGGYDPGDFGAMDRRRHRLLDAFFKVIEREGGKIKQGKHQELIAVVDGESIEFGLREKRKQTRRPLTPDEAKWASSGDKGWRQEMVDTGLLIFEIKPYLPANLPRHWTETDVVGLEDLLPEIASTFITAGPLLAEQSRKRAEAERERQIAERRRYEEEQRRKRDANRVRRFKELAKDWRDVALAREFLAELRSRTSDGAAEVGGKPLADWLDWVDARLKEADPMTYGAEGIFDTVADITEWSYQERRFGHDR
jgi:hypothetical protein